MRLFAQLITYCEDLEYCDILLKVQQLLKKIVISLLHIFTNQAVVLCN